MFRKKKESELKNLVEQTKKKEKIKKESVDKKWIITIIIITFIISFLLSFIADSTIPNISLMVDGIDKSEEAKMTGITPDIFTLIGI